MALLLYRLGRFSYRRPWRVLVAWLLLLLVAIGAGLLSGGAMRESFAIPGTQSQAALDRLSAVFPQTAGGSASVVVIAPKGSSIEAPEAETAIGSAVSALEQVDGVEQVVSPFSQYATDAVSPDAQAAIIRVQFTADSSEVTTATLEGVKTAAKSVSSGGLEVRFAGQVFEDLTYGLTVTEIIGVVFAAVVLIVAFGSVLAAGLPLASALIAVGTTMGGILVVAALAPVSSATPLLAVMIGIAVGIDYALFVLSRHRHQLANGMDVEESAATAVGTAGSAVIFAGVTVMIALLGLLIVGIPFLGIMGVAASIAVFLAMATAVTLLPALFGLAGERLRPKAGSRAHRRETGADTKPTMGRRWVQLVLKAPWAFVIGVVVVLGTLAIPAATLHLALPTAAGQHEGTTARDGYDALTEHFGEGANGPLLVMLDVTQAKNETLMDDLAHVAALVRSVPGIKTAGDALPNPTVDSAIVQVIPTTGPTDPATSKVVEQLRALAPQIERETGMVMSVTGYTAVAIDISQRLGESLIPFGLVVVGLSFVLLTLVFRSILVPLKAALSFLLSVVAAFGVVVAIFQWGWLAEALHVVPGPIISFMPVLLMAIIFGLAMDYEVFLVSGMREAFVRGADPKAAVEHGFAQGARVVTAAALIMFFVFAAFVPEGAGVIKAIALGLAAGIFFDAFLVRMTLVPALMALFGRAAWWLPGVLRRDLPELDIEGEHLRHHRDDLAWAEQSAERDAVAFEGLVAGDERLPVGPLGWAVPLGGVGVVVGEGPARDVIAATLAGRLAPLRGRVHVLGHPLPGDATAVRRRVSVVDLASASQHDDETPVGELVAEHRVLAGRGTSDDPTAWRVATERVLRELGAPNPRIGEHATLRQLDPVARGLARTQLGLAEGPALLVLDTGLIGHGAESAALLAAVVDGVARLAPPETTIIVQVDRDAELDRLAERLRLGTRPTSLLRVGAPNGAAPRHQQQPILKESAS